MRTRYVIKKRSQVYKQRYDYILAFDPTFTETSHYKTFSLEQKESPGGLDVYKEKEVAVQVQLCTTGFGQLTKGTQKNF